jgi:hypothetical protein
MPRSIVSKKIFYENSANYELDPVERQSMFFRKGYMLKILNPPYPDPQTKDDYRTVIVKCMIDNCR